MSNIYSNLPKRGLEYRITTSSVFYYTKYLLVCLHSVKITTRSQTIKRYKTLYSPSQDLLTYKDGVVNVQNVWSNT